MPINWRVRRIWFELIEYVHFIVKFELALNLKDFIRYRIQKYQKFVKNL